MSLNPSISDPFSGADPHLHGFEEAKRDLLMADSVNERANAAFKLGWLGNIEGVAYLIAALYDNDAKVRNAAAESLGQIGDATALGPLMDLQHREGSHAVISNAISLISSREKNSVSPDSESAKSQEKSLRDDGATVNEPAQLSTESKVRRNFLSEAVAEIDAIFKAQWEQTGRVNGAHENGVNNSHADAVESHSQPQPIAATTITDLDAGFELLRQAEARQSELIAEAEARLREQQEARQKVEVIVRERSEQEKRLAEEIEALQATEQELAQRMQEAEERRRLQDEAVRRSEEKMRACAEKEKRRVAKLEERQQQAEEESRKRTEQEEQLKNRIALLAQTASEQIERIAEAEAQIAETLCTLKADEERHVAEAQAALKLQKEMRKKAAAKAKQSSKQVQRLSQEIEALQKDAEQQARKIADSEAELARAHEAGLAQLAVDARLREEVERLQQAEAGTRLAVEATERAVTNLRSQVEVEEGRFAELGEIKRKSEVEAKERAGREAEMKRQLKRLAQAEQQQGKRLQKAETSLQAKQEILNQTAAKLQRLTEEEALCDSQIASLRETLQQVETESQERAREQELRISELAELRNTTEADLNQRKEFAQQLTAELDALCATSQDQLKAISELEAGVHQAQAEAEQRSVREAELKQQMSSLADAEQEMCNRLQAAESSLELQQQTHEDFEREWQQRAEEIEEQLAHLAATRERAEAEGQRLAAHKEELTTELAALRAAEENELMVITKLEEAVQQTRTEAQQLISREAQLNAEFQILQATLETQRESQAATDARRAEQEESLKEMEGAARLLVEEEALRVGQLQALRQQLESDSQSRLENERQLNVAIEALRAEENEQLARLENLRQHAATLEEAKQLRVLDESNLSAEIAALEATIFQAEQTISHAEESRQQLVSRQQAEARERRALLEAERSRIEAETQKRAAEELQLTLEIAALRQREAEQIQRLQQADADWQDLADTPKVAEVEVAMDEVEVIYESQADIPESQVLQSEDSSQMIVVESDSFSFETSISSGGNEEVIVSDNSELEMPVANIDEVEVPATGVGFDEQAKSLSLVTDETGLAQVNLDTPLSRAVGRLESPDPTERCQALIELSQLGAEESFDLIANQFDDPSVQVRNAAARALCELDPDRTASLTRALREAKPERRRRIGAAFAGSGLASDAINCLAGEGRDVTYDAFAILFLMAKAGEVQPLIETIEKHADIAVRLAVIKLLAFSNQSGVVPAFRRLAVRASLPAEVRSAVMEAIHDISTPNQESKMSAA